MIKLFINLKVCFCLSFTEIFFTPASQTFSVLLQGPTQIVLYLLFKELNKRLAYLFVHPLLRGTGAHYKDLLSDVKHFFKNFLSFL